MQLKNLLKTFFPNNVQQQRGEKSDQQNWNIEEFSKDGQEWHEDWGNDSET